MSDTVLAPAAPEADMARLAQAVQESLTDAMVERLNDDDIRDVVLAVRPLDWTGPVTWVIFGIFRQCKIICR